MKRRPNILFLFADDMRYNTIHYLGNPDIITPNLDYLAKNGTSFMNAYIPGGTCAAVCMPSRAMLNTGKTLYHLKDHGAQIPEDHALLGETLKNAGYKTFGTGKWHNGYTSYARSFMSGGEIFFGGMYDHWKVPVYDYDDTGNYVKVVNDVMNPGYSNAMVPVRMDHVHWGKHSTDLFADLACNWIEQYDDEKPFYMYVSYMAPHDPRSMPRQFFDMYDVDKITLPHNYMPQHPFDFGITNVRDEQLEAYPRTEQAIRRHMRDYYAMISHLDASIGRILDSLKKTGMFDDTIILFSADNGLGLGEHGLMGKQNCYEHSIKMPLIFSGPGIPKDERRNGMVYLLDIFPTLCELTQVHVPESVEGISFAGQLNDPEVKNRDVMYFGYRDKIRGVKTERYKLIHYRYKTQSWVQLFDLKEDPYEIKDLSSDASMAGIRAELEEKLTVLSHEWDDDSLTVSNNFWHDRSKIEAEPFGFV
jgi:arylsulfatase A-like enzyme